MFDSYSFGEFSPYEPNLTSLFSYAILVLALLGILLAVITFIGEKKEERLKFRPYECGVDSAPLSSVFLPVPFYLVAIFFVIFDIETAFIFSWAVAFKPLGIIGWFRMTVFILVLLLSLVYIWKKGGLSWRKMPLGVWSKSKTRPLE